MAETDKPLLLICSSAIPGHVRPCKTIAKQLINRGYEVTCVTGTRFGPCIKEVGATFVPLQGFSDYRDLLSELAKKLSLKERLPGLDGIPYDLKYVPTAFIGIGMTPVLLSSQDVPPLGSGLFPDNSPAGRERNKALNARFQNGTCAELTKCFNDNLEELGAQRPSTFFLDIPYILPDRFIQLCTPGVEYPRSDAPKKLLFTGGLPKAHGGFKSPRIPPTSESSYIFVSQGTLALKYEDLIIPTIQAFANHDSTIVIAALGDKGASLPDSFPIPENTYVEDLIPFDDVLPYCDVFVTNGGYGAFQHGLSNGCPMVMGGDTEEKAENSMRCEWAGINLRSGRPGVENLRRGVEKVLADGKYRERAEEVRKEMEGSDSVGVFETLIQEVVREKRVNSLVG